MRNRSYTMLRIVGLGICLASCKSDSNLANEQAVRAVEAYFQKYDPGRKLPTAIGVKDEGDEWAVEVPLEDGGAVVEIFRVSKNDKQIKDIHLRAYHNGENDSRNP